MLLSRPKDIRALMIAACANLIRSRWHLWEPCIHSQGVRRMRKVVLFLKNDSGAVATEYFLLAAAFALALCAGVNVIMDVLVLR